MQKMDRDDPIPGLPPIHLSEYDLNTFRHNARSNQTCYNEVDHWLTSAKEQFNSLDEPEQQLFMMLHEHATMKNIPIHEIVCAMLSDSIGDKDEDSGD